MKIRNDSNGTLLLSDLPGAQTGSALAIGVGQEVLIYNEDAEKSNQLGSLITNGSIFVVNSIEEPSSGQPQAQASPALVSENQMVITNVPSADQVLAAIDEGSAHWVTGGGGGSQGPQGNQGSAGAQGSQGSTGSGTQGSQGGQGGDGAQGGDGNHGADGAQGDQGDQGDQGATGSGSQGNQGDQGSAGTPGTQGPQGDQGTTGSGTQGSQGNQGNDGADGDQGPQGNQGTTGSGTQGNQGDQGTTGTGTQGNQGNDGADGDQGPQGNQGTTGSGTQGNQGDQGSQGNQGNQGDQGNQGATGSVFTRYTVLYTDFNSGFFVEDIPLCALPARTMLKSVTIHTDIPFLGGSLSGYTLSVGLSTNPTKYAPAFDVFQATGDTVGQTTVSGYVEDYGTGSTIVSVVATPTGGRTTTATQGKAFIVVETALLPVMA